MTDQMLLTTKEAAQVLHVGINQLRALVKQNAIPVIRLHQRTLRFYRPALEEWAKQKSRIAG